ncbi:MAG: hypothetical protein WCA79_21360 [Anaerolineales bacterium]
MCDANKMVMQIIEVENFYKGGEAIGTGIRPEEVHTFFRRYFMDWPAGSISN